MNPNLSPNEPDQKEPMPDEPMPDEPMPAEPISSESPEPAPVRRKRSATKTFLHVLRCVCIVCLTLFLTLSLTLTAFVRILRQNITPEYVYAYADTLDYPRFPLPAGSTSEDGFLTISQLMQENFAAVGFALTESDVELIFDQFSVPTILAGTAQDVVSWMLFNGSRPVLDAEEIATTALSGVDDSLMMVLAFLGDPVELVSSFLAKPLSTLDTSGFLDALEPVRFWLSQTVMELAISVCLMVEVLLFCLHRCRLGRTYLPWGIAYVGTGILLGAARLALPRLLPRLTVIYADYLTTFFTPVLRWLGNGALLMLLVGVLMVAAGSLDRLYERVCARR